MIIEARDLTKIFTSHDQHVLRALDGVSFSLEAGEHIGIVGESGCGKTTLAKVVMGLVAPDAGDVLWQGRPVWGDRVRERQFRQVVRMVFQDPFSSLDPRFRVRDILREAFCSSSRVTRYEQECKMHEALVSVGLSVNILGRYPHEFSGGERQRIAIARAIISSPEVLVLDEAVSALDVLVQQDILELLQDLQKARQMTYIFISHDLKAVRKIARKIIVMCQGKIVECGAAANIMDAPQHPYTQELLAAALNYTVSYHK